MHEGERGIQLKILCRKSWLRLDNTLIPCLLIHTTKILQLHRADAEKTMHPKLITSDTGQQISELNCKAEEEKDKKRAEVRKHQKF
ncbi:hypothetical protein ES288_A11G105100v1 [Gossypium darwinii]|uniref:Uncharacterized protein n=1 Tax=Gossypium darwinii TaxID=34276 RepID=A0A5D2EJN5_GOSDA|nr:hypothetical protein ES288_A11G105100v1 [Gossypium darwinii]